MTISPSLPIKCTGEENAGGIAALGKSLVLLQRIGLDLIRDEEQVLTGQGGIGVRYGCHCAHLLIKRLLNINPLLEWFQGLILILFPKIILPGLVRVSLGIENSEEDVDTLIHVLGKIARQPRVGMVWAGIIKPGIKNIYILIYLFIIDKAKTWISNIKKIISFIWIVRNDSYICTRFKAKS